MLHYLLRPVVVALGMLFLVGTLDAQVRRPEARFLKGIERTAHKASTIRYRPDIVIRQSRWDDDWQNATQVRSLYRGDELAARYRDHWNAETGSWEPLERTDFGVSTFDGYSDVELAMTYTGWVFVSRTDYRVLDGIVTGYQNIEWTGSEWVPVENVTYALSGSVPVGAEFETWDGAGWAPSERVHITESDAGVLESWDSFGFLGWVPSARIHYPGMTIESLYAAWTTVETDLGDLDGLLLSLRLPDYTEEMHDGSNWIPFARQTTNRTYDTGSGALTGEVITSDIFNGSEWEPASRQTFAYRVVGAARSVPVSAELESADGSGGLLDVLTETYEAREDIGKVISATLSVNTEAGVYEMERASFNWVGLGLAREDPARPSSFQLAQNYPNPFNPETRVAFRLSRPETVHLAVYDMTGREVAVLATGLQPSGKHEVVWRAEGLPSGVYLYRLQAGGQTVTRAMTLLK